MSQLLASPLTAPAPIRITTAPGVDRAAAPTVGAPAAPTGIALHQFTELGVELGQGYLLAEPIGAPHIQAWMERARTTVLETTSDETHWQPVLEWTGDET